MRGAPFPEGRVPSTAEYGEALVAWLESSAEAKPFRDVGSVEAEPVFAQGLGLQRLLFEAGWSRWGWPEEYGGRGGSCLLRAAMYEALTVAGYPQPTSFLILEVLAPMLVAHAPHLARVHFALLLAGDEVWSQGFSEPDAGSDLASLRTRAVEEGDHWRLNGQKIWTSFGHLSHRCVVLARTGGEGHRGLSMFVVDVDSPGVTMRPIRAANGRNEFSEVFFDDVLVPAGRLVGAPGDGWSLAMFLLQWERGMYPWQRQGHLLHHLERHLPRAAVDPGASADAIGRTYLDLLALRLRGRETLRSLAAGENPGPAISVDKLLLSRVEQEAVDTFRDLTHPETEFGTDLDGRIAAADFLYARITGIYGGSAQMQRTILAQHVLGLPRG